ncbi:MAG: fructose-1,6-bisphosphatase-3, partial [bacterium]
MSTPINPSKRTKIDQLSQEILKIDTALDSKIPTTLWISDLHGAGDRFVSILRGRFGLLYQTCIEALPKTFSPEKVAYLGKIIRNEGYYFNKRIPMDSQDVIQCLVDILRYKTDQTQFSSKAVLPNEYQNIILKLINGDKVPDLVYENNVVSDRLIAKLSVSIKRLLLDHLIVLGDIFDRGPQPDKIIRILASKAYRDNLHLVFGNHDILWMGACVGNQSLIIEAMRITCRYDHIDLLKRFGIDISKLQKFATATYPAETVKGKFKAKTDIFRSMEKALVMIQFKLEEKTIHAHPEYEMESRLWLNRLAEKIKTGNTEGLLDTSFPTIDLENPIELTSEEQEVLDDLTEQFVHGKKLKRLIKFFFEKGKTYHIHNSILNIHASVPSTEDGELEEFLGYSGKALLDYIHSVIVKTGDAYINNKPQKESNIALFFYLWSGAKSPFFGKSAMKTFERYFLADKTTHRERAPYWTKNIQTEAFK